MARVSKYERSEENDIKYRGPLSYRHFNILGWLCISFKVLNVLTSLGIQMDPGSPQWMYMLDNIAETVSVYALPFFLLANFAVILDKKYTYKQQLIKFGALSLLIVVLFAIVKEHYITGIAAAVVGDKAEVTRTLDELIYQLSMTGNMVFNLFIDLFLCTLFMFFLEYEPKRVFKGKLLLLFRFLAIIPVLYEVGALVLRVNIAMGNANPPYIVYTFLTTKPFMSFILFIILALHIKNEERRFRKKGKSEEDFLAYGRTNVHSLRFSIYTSVMILITGAIDFIIYIGSTIYLTYTATGGDITAEVTDELLEAASKVVEAWRFGSHFWMIALIPLILLFSYTRRHKDMKIDSFIPIGGIGLAIIVGIEGLYQGIVMNVPIIMNNLDKMLMELLSM